SFELKRAIDACKPDDDVGRMALQMAEARIAELKGENDALRKAVEDYQRENAQRVSPLRSPEVPRDGVVTLPPTEYTPHPLPRAIDWRDAVTVGLPLEQRYPLSHLDPVS